MTTTYEFTAFAEEDLLSGGDTNLDCGDSFVMPGEATTCFTVKDDDAFLSGDSVYNENADDHSYQTASIAGASGNEVGNGGQIYAESYFWVQDGSGNWYVLVEIEQEGVDNADYFTFFTGNGYTAPAPGTELYVHSQCNVDSDWIDFKCLDAGEKNTFVECDYPGAVKLDFEGLASGEVVSDQFEGVTIFGSENGEGNSDNDAMIFDSNTLSGGDSDLLTTKQNNILIVSEDDDSSDPDDAIGGTLFFTFDNPANVFDIKIIDAEEGGFIDMFDADGNLLKCVEIPNGVDGGIQQVLLEQEDVTTLKVRLNGSGAVDDLYYVPGEDPTGTISGTVFCDLDCDGLQDAGSETCVLGPNLVVNGDFEDNALNNAGAIWDASSSDLPGWFFVGSGKADLLEENLEGHGNATGQAIIDMDQGSILRQEVNVPSAGTYVLSLDLLQNPHIGDNDNRIKVFINGVEREIVRAEGQNTVEIELDLPAGVVRLDFKSLTTVNDGPGIDEIKLQEKTIVTEVAEPGKEGVTVALLDADGNAVLDDDGNAITTVTDADGNYTFENVPEGDYQVQFTAPDGTEFTLQDEGSDDSIDSDVDATGNSGVITVTADQTTDIDAGLKEVEEPGEVRTFQLTNHTSNGDNYGLRLDDLLGTGNFVFDFEAPGACMFATIDPNNDTVHIFGTAVGSDGSIFRIDFVYNNAEPKAGDDDIQVDDQFDKTNIGSIERLDQQGVVIEKFELADKAGSHPFTFRIGDEDDDSGHRGATGDSGWGWLYVDGARNAVQDWIFELEDKIELTASDDFITVSESEGAGDTETLDDGNTSILANDEGASTVVMVNGVVGNVGEFINLSQGRVKINADGTVDFDADGDFEALVNGESEVVTVTYSIGEEAVGNLIVNGGFENHPTLTRGSGTALWDTFEEIEGWTTPVGVLEIQEGTHGGTPDNLATNAVLELDSDDSADTNATIVQTVDVTRTGTYILAFDYSPREKHGVIAPTSILNIWVNGTLIDSITADELGYVRHTYELTLTEGANEIGFSAGGTDDTFGALIDDVTLVGKIKEEATVQITVLGENDLADGDETATVNEDAGLVVLPNVLDNTTDPEGGDPTVVAVGAPSNGGVFSIGPDGSATFETNGEFEALAEGETAITSVEYTVEDAAGDQVTSTVTVTVEGVNDLEDEGEAVTVGEDAGLTTLPNVLDNTTDPEAGDPTVVNVGTPSNGGVFVINADGSATFDTNGEFEALAVGETATTTIEYTVEDAAGDQVTSTITVTVEGVNDLEDEGEAVTVNEDAGLTTLPNVLDNTTDPEAGDPTVVNVGTPSNGGVFVINPDGSATFDTNGEFEDLAVGETATTTIEYTVEDAAGDQVTSTVTVTVEGVNDLADEDETATVGEDDGLVPLTNVLDNTTDPEAGDPTVVAVGTASNGGVFSIGPDGETTFDTNGEFEALGDGETAITSVEYTVEDAAGDQVTSTVTVTVEGVNDLEDEDECVEVSEDAGLTVLTNALDNAVDPEAGDPFIFAVVDDGVVSESSVGQPIAGSNGGLFIINADGTTSFDPNGEFEFLGNGESTTTEVIYCVTDADGAVVESFYKVIVQGVNDLADEGESATVSEDAGLVALANVLDNTTDPEAGDPVVVAVGAPSNGGVFSIGPNGEASFDTNGDFEDLAVGETAVTTVEYTVEDAAGDQVTSTVTITVEGVNDLADEGEAVTVGEDDGLVALPNVLDNTTDPEAGDPVVVAVGAPSNGGVFSIGPDGEATFDTNGDFEDLAVGETAITTVDYTVEDAAGDQVTSTVTITVEGVNDLADDDETTTVTEDAGLVTLDNVLDNTDDPEAGDPTVVAVGAPTNGGVFTINPDGSATFDTNGEFEFLASGESTTTSVTYTVEDAAGDQVTSTYTIIVKGFNDLADDDETATVGEDAGLVALDNVLDNTTDPEAGDPVVVNVGTASNGGVFTIAPDGTATFDTNGEFEDLGAGETAITSVTYTVEDVAGDQVSSTVTVTVLGAEEPFGSIAGRAFCDADGNALDNAGDTAIVQQTVILLNPDGTAVLDTFGDPILAFTGIDGSYSFDPIPVGDYRVGFEVLGSKEFVAQGADLDGDGRSDDPNASDVDDAAAPFAVSLGFVSVTVQATDVFTVNAGEDVTDVDAGMFVAALPPDAVDDALTTTEDDPVFADILANDSDANGDPISIVSANGTGVNTAFNVTSADGRVGTAFVSATGALNFAFDPNGEFDGLALGETDTVTISYTITDGTGLQDTADVVVTVNGLNDGPDAIDDAFTIPEDGVVFEDILGNDSDPDGDALQIVEANGTGVNTQFDVTSVDGRTGTAIVSADGALNFAFDTNSGFDDLNDGETDTVTVSYTVTDGNGLTGTATVTVTVEGAGQPTALVSGSLDNTGPGDLHLAVILDASEDAVSVASAFPVGDLDGDGNVGTTMDQMLSKVSDLALTLQSTDLISLIPSGFNSLPDTATVVTFGAGALQAAIAADQSSGGEAAQQAIYNGIVSSYTAFDFAIDFPQAFDAAASAFAATSGFEQNKVIAMVASEASFDDQGQVGFVGFDSALGSFDDVINPPSNADVDILIVDPLASINAANLGLLDSDGVADVDVTTDKALADFVDDAPIVNSAADIVSFTVTVDGVAVSDIDVSDLTPTADGFDFLPTEVLEGVIDVFVGLDLNGDGFADQGRLLSNELSEAERTLAQGDVFDFTIDTFVSDQISLGG